MKNSVRKMKKRENERKKLHEQKCAKDLKMRKTERKRRMNESV